MDEIKKSLEDIQGQLNDIKTSQENSSDSLEQRIQKLEEKFKSSEATGGVQTGNPFGFLSTNTASSYPIHSNSNQSALHSGQMLTLMCLGYIG